MRWMIVVNRDGMAHRRFPGMKHTMCGRVPPADCDFAPFQEYDGRTKCSQCSRRLIGWLREWHGDLVEGLI